MSDQCCCGSDPGTMPPELKQKFDELDLYIAELRPDDNPERSRGFLIQILHKAQNLFGYLPEEVQKFVAARLKLSPAEIYGVISFYSYFTDKPVGRYKINVCTGTACFVKGASKVQRRGDHRGRKILSRRTALRRSMQSCPRRHGKRQGLWKHDGGKSCGHPERVYGMSPFFRTGEI